MARRRIQLVASSALLGLGVAMLLDSRLGADGFAMLIDGLSIQTGWEFVVVNVIVSALLVAMAWVKGVRPGLGTITLPVVVGAVVSIVAESLPSPESMAVRVVEFAVAFVVVCVGVAGYLATDLGAGPTEAAAIAWDPPVPFRWSYSGVQIVSAAIGFWCGADLGVGTLLVVVLIGPCVDRLRPLLTPSAVAVVPVASPC